MGLQANSNCTLIRKSALIAEPVSPECPVEAIFPEDEVPESWLGYIDINHKWYENKE